MTTTSPVVVPRPPAWKERDGEGRTGRRVVVAQQRHGPQDESRFFQIGTTNRCRVPSASARRSAHWGRMTTTSPVCLRLYSPREGRILLERQDESRLSRSPFGTTNRCPDLPSLLEVFSSVPKQERGAVALASARRKKPYPRRRATNRRAARCFHLVSPEPRRHRRRKIPPRRTFARKPPRTARECPCCQFRFLKQRSS